MSTKINAFWQGICTCPQTKQVMILDFCGIYTLGNNCTYYRMKSIQNLINPLLDWQKMSCNLMEDSYAINFIDDSL